MEKVRPFSNGTEFEKWNNRNFDDGKIKKSIADKIGLTIIYISKIALTRTK